MPGTPCADGPQLRLLGRPRLSSGAAAAALNANDAALLALLALAGPQPRRHLAALLWPDLPTARQRDNLRQRLMRLDQRAGGLLFTHDGEVVALAAGVRHDLDGDVPPPTEAEQRLLGHFAYDDQPELAAWGARARRHRRERVHAAWAAEADALEQQRRYDDALPYARRLAADEPLQEHAQRRLMHLHYLRGDRGAALAVHADLCERLRQELGSSPDAQTRELAALIERGECGPAAPPAGPTAAQRAQLRRPQRLLQRQAQWQQMEQAWAEGRGLLLTGPGGMGKTRLLEDFAQARAIGLRLQAQHGDARQPYALLARLARLRGAHAAALEADARAELARLDPSFGRPDAARCCRCGWPMPWARCSTACRRSRSTTCTWPTPPASNCCRRCWPHRARPCWPPGPNRCRRPWPNGRATPARWPR